MKKGVRRAFALLLSIALTLTLCPWALSDYPADTRSGVTGDYTGKTVILHSNDVHGEIMGYAYIAALRTEFENRGADVILADAGDFSQGDPTVSLSKGADAIVMMNAAGYDVATLGNHEFDFGYEQLMDNLSNVEFPVICADVYRDGETILPPTWMYEDADSGLKIGFFGMETPETQTKVNPGLIQGIQFVSITGGDEETLYSCAQRQIDALRGNGADLVIALAHLGVDAESASNECRSVDMYHNTQGIDLILDGHSHTVMTAGEDGEPVQSTGTKFANIGVVVIDNAGKTITDRYLLPTKTTNDDGAVVSEMNKDPEVAALAQEIIDRVEEEYGYTFAESEILLNGERTANRTRETNLGDLITDAIVWKALKENRDEDGNAVLTVGSTSVDEKHVVGVTNGGGIRASIQPGEVTLKDVNTVLPFGNTIAVVYVTGAELLEALEASTFVVPQEIGGHPQTCGITFSLDTSIPYDAGELYPNSTYHRPASIQRVEISAINGEVFDPAAIYAVVTNNFCAAGGDTYYAFKNASAQFDTGIVMDEAVTEYIREELYSSITAEQYGRVRGDRSVRVSFPSNPQDTESALEDAFALIPSDGSGFMIKLTADTSLTQTVSVEDGQNVTLDLAGHSVAAGQTGGIVVQDGASLTVTSSEEGGYIGSEIAGGDGGASGGAASNADALIVQYGGQVDIGSQVMLDARERACIRVVKEQAPDESAESDAGAENGESVEPLRSSERAKLNLKEGADLSAVGSAVSAVSVTGGVDFNLSGGHVASGATGVSLYASGVDSPTLTMDDGSIRGGASGIYAENATVAITTGSIEATNEAGPADAVYYTIKPDYPGSYAYLGIRGGAFLHAVSSTEARALYLDGGHGSVLGAAQLTASANETAVGVWIDSGSVSFYNDSGYVDDPQAETGRPQASAFSESGTADAARVIVDETDEENSGVFLVSDGVFVGGVYAVNSAGERLTESKNVYLRGGLYSVRPEEAYLARAYSDDGETSYDLLRIAETQIDGETFYQLEEIAETHTVSYGYDYNREDGSSFNQYSVNPDRIQGMRVTVSVEDAPDGTVGSWIVEDGAELEIVEGSLTEPSFTFIMPDRDVSISGEFYENAEMVQYEGKLVILHSNDVHGEIMGYSYMAALKQDFERKGAESVLLMDAGDFSQGDPTVSLSKGADAITMMNATGYDVATLGNHEFDFGYEQLMSNLEGSEFSVICADVYKDGERILSPSWTSSYACGPYENPYFVRIGVFGMETPETQTKVNPGLIQGVHFVSNTGDTDETLYTCAQAQIDELREDGADIVIALTHLGVDAESAPDGHRSVDLYEHTQGIDLILDGHSHTVMTCWTDGAPYNPLDPDAQAPGEDAEIIPIQSTGTKFANIGVVVIDIASKRIEDHYLLPTKVTDEDGNVISEMDKDPEVAALAQSIIDRVDEEYGQVFAQSEILLNGERDPGNRTEETNLGDLITDAIVWKVLKENRGEDGSAVLTVGDKSVDEDHVVGITNGGGIRASIQPGDVTRKDLNTVLPFGNTVAVVFVTGAELLEALEASTYATPEALGGYPQTFGIEFTLDTTKAYDQGAIYPQSTYYSPATIQRVAIAKINGEAFDPAATYAVVTNNFCAAGGDTYYVFQNASAQFDTGIVMDEAVMEYVEEALNGVISRETYETPRGDQTIVKAAPVTPAPVVSATPTPAPASGTPTPTPKSDSGSDSASGSGQGCYVATSVYGSYDCPEVWTLRRFRDEVLAETWYGRLFIHFYYAVSPTAVKLFGDSAWFQNFFRGVLDPWVADLQSSGFASTPYQDQSW